jgi:hypothetical protein
MGIKLSRSGLIAHHNSLINSHRIPSLITMTAFLLKSKASILDLMKSMPDAHITEEEDFVMWGRQFVDVAISHI